MQLVADGLQQRLFEGDPDGRPEEAEPAWHKVQAIENRDVPIWVPLQAQIASAVRKSVTGAWVEGGGQLHIESAANSG